jgi:hypothetical protein
MSQSITIKSVNYDGEIANIIFKPADEETAINLGEQVLPFIFQPYLLEPPRTVYGTYTILVLSGDCPTVLNVPKPTPTPTPTVTPTKTPTPTPTVTPSPTPTYNPCNITQTPTPTPTKTPSPTPILSAYLFIEPIDGAVSIGQWMYDGGSNFYGFSNTSQPTQNQTIFNSDMNRYVNFTGWTNGYFPTIISQSVPQINGGVDSFGNAKVAYNFLTTEVPENTVSGDAWYTWIIPVSLTNNEIQTVIDLNVSNNPNLFTQVNTESTIYCYTFNYTGSTIPNTTYRVYTTFPNTIFQINDSQNIYFRGNSISP